MRLVFSESSLLFGVPTVPCQSPVVEGIGTSAVAGGVSAHLGNGPGREQQRHLSEPPVFFFTAPSLYYTISALWAILEPHIG